MCTTVQLYTHCTLLLLWPETLVNGCRIPVLRVTETYTEREAGGWLIAQQLEAGGWLQERLVTGASTSALSDTSEVVHPSQPTVIATVQIDSL